MVRAWIHLQRSHGALRVARGIMIGLALLPIAVPLCEAWRPTHIFGTLLRSLYGLQCHQRAIRSLAWFCLPLPVCARCFGIYSGIGLAGLVCRPRLRMDAYKAWMLIGATLVTMDVASEWLQLRPANAGFRFVVGALLAYGTSLAILESLRPRRG